jgi:hypothetical protein
MSDLKRVRSPNYPAISLPDAIEATKKLSAKMGRNAGPKEAIAKILGYSGLNGASMSAISALVKYGLLEKSGEDLKLAERTMKLIAAQSPQEHTEAMFAAAHAPVLFAELIEQYPNGLPGDEIIRAYLKRKGFADSALPQVIQSFRETMEFVTAETGSYNEAAQSEAGAMDAAKTGVVDIQNSQRSGVASLTESQTFTVALDPLSSDAPKFGKVILPVPLTADQKKRLKAFIESL